jgi:glycosyltransferase involved in cell wall biosynthesis
MKISIIIPVYNVEKYLNQCLESVASQTLKDLEAICINDGSPDNSLQILRAFEKKDSRFVVIDQKNTGVGQARNNGLNVAKGEFVTFMDPDDYYPANDILERMYDAAKANNAKICGGSFSEDHDGKMVLEFRKAYEKYVFKEDKIIDFRDYQFDYGYMRFIYSLNMIRENNIYFPLYKRFQDPPFFVKAMICARRFYALKMVTYCYRWGHQNIKWDDTRTCDLVKGLIDNLVLSKEAGLAELHYLTIQRIEKFYINQINNSLESGNHKLMYLLIDANSKIDKELLASKNMKEEYLLEPLKKLLDTYKQIKELTQQNQRIKESSSYKIGRAITYLPRKARKLLRKWRKK